MKKYRFLIIVIIMMISFCFNIYSIRAKNYPFCDISQYGTVSVTAGGNSTEKADFIVGGENGKVSTLHNSMLTGNMVLDETAKKSQEKEDNNNWWRNGTATITYTIDAGPGGRVSEITYSLYEDTKLLSYTKVCQSQIEPKLYPNSEVAIVTFKINKGHLAKINLNAKYKAGINDGYVAGGGSGGVSVSVKKGLSGNENMPTHTTNGKEEQATSTASAGCTNSDGTGCDDTEKIISSSNAKTEPGTKVGGKKTIITDEKGNIIGGSTNNCTDVRVVINNYWKYVMVLAPVLLIVLITVDFFKAMASNDADIMKKTVTNVVKRTIAAVILLALPALLSYILGIFGLPLCI